MKIVKSKLKADPLPRLRRRSFEAKLGWGFNPINRLMFPKLYCSISLPLLSFNSLTFRPLSSNKRGRGLKQKGRPRQRRPKREQGHDKKGIQASLRPYQGRTSEEGTGRVFMSLPRRLPDISFCKGARAKKRGGIPEIR